MSAIATLQPSGMPAFSNTLDLFEPLDARELQNTDGGVDEATKVLVRGALCVAALIGTTAVVCLAAGVLVYAITEHHWRR